MEHTMMDTLRKIADEVVKAIRLIPTGDDRGKEICMGADGTPTSQIDKIAENTVLRYIELNGIKLNILSEEIGLVDNGYKETLILDPIDGTNNSTMGVPLYTISMAVGRGTMNGVHTAYIRNLVTGDEFTAEKGKGAYLNGRKLHVKRSFNPKRATMMIYLGNGADPKSFSLAKRCKTSRAFGCASLEMAYVATGEADGFMMHAENYQRAIRIVDIAASALILREAGGELYSLEGEVLDMPLDVQARANFVAVSRREVFDFAVGGSSISDIPRSFGIYANTRIPDVEKIANKVLDELKGEKVMVDTAIAKMLGIRGTPISKMRVDIIISIGGDGTILRVLQDTDIPVVGLNAGLVGFLTMIDTDKIPSGINRLKKGKFIIQRRPRISVSCGGEKLGDAVNEAVVHTDTIAKIRRFKVYVNDILATDIRADGMMLSTPTGSTCYAMSFGAPTVDYGVDAWELIPMAAFNYASRPMIIPTSSKVIMEAVLDNGCVVVIDGQKEVKIPGGSKVEFTKSRRYASFVVFDTDFYSRVRDKLVKKL